MHISYSVRLQFTMCVCVCMCVCVYCVTYGPLCLTQIKTDLLLFPMILIDTSMYGDNYTGYVHGSWVKYTET